MADPAASGATPAPAVLEDADIGCDFSPFATGCGAAFSGTAFSSASSAPHFPFPIFSQFCHERSRLSAHIRLIAGKYSECLYLKS